MWHSIRTLPDVSPLDVIHVIVLTLVNWQWWNDRTHRGGRFAHDRSVVSGVRKHRCIFVLRNLCVIDQRGQ